MFEKHEIYRAIAHLAYAIAMVDGKVQDKEKQAFANSVYEQLGEDGWVAESRFEMLEENQIPTLEHVFNHTLFVLQKSKDLLNQDMKDKFIRVIESIALAHKSSNEVECFIAKRFKVALESL